jgi:hypothetical protein
LEKFSSNSGWCSGVDPILEALSHWTWCHTQERELVGDLQGRRGDGSLPHLGDDYYYLLTDPAICSSDREYGESDLAAEVSRLLTWGWSVPTVLHSNGLTTCDDCLSCAGYRCLYAFFTNHTCNEWCERLDIEYERPHYS